MSYNSIHDNGSTIQPWNNVAFNSVKANTIDIDNLTIDNLTVDSLTSQNINNIVTISTNALTSNSVNTINIGCNNITSNVVNSQNINNANTITTNVLNTTTINSANIDNASNLDTNNVNCTTLTAYSTITLGNDPVVNTIFTYEIYGSITNFSTFLSPYNEAKVIFEKIGRQCILHLSPRTTFTNIFINLNLFQCTNNGVMSIFLTEFPTSIRNAILNNTASDNSYPGVCSIYRTSTNILTQLTCVINRSNGAIEITNLNYNYSTLGPTFATTDYINDIIFKWTI